ncbi:chaperone [Virgisporangium aliadipatigenens]|uniref:Chaperone n=1 Tax=Virgisporangium aliadipatigenens TaxID=741659 RepID=A0A8J4DTL9_9ACTN|nr:AAA family ATPase [Virgisporangium aliadipatigenens]GIJ48357.1 chaperone [Virgisporangium aliadipatigenens]
MTGYPAWLREVRTALSINSQVVLYGNVRDIFLLPGGTGLEPCDLRAGVHRILAAEGFPTLVVADAVAGVETLTHGKGPPEPRKPWGAKGIDLNALADLLERTATAPARAAVLVDYASRLVLDPTRLEPAEHRFFARVDRLSRAAYPQPAGDDPRPFYNPVVWVVDNERDLPLWLTAGNEDIRQIAVPLPDLGARLTAAQWLAGVLNGYAEATPDARQDLRRRLAEQTRGMTLRGMMAIARLAKRMETPLADIDEAVRCYRVGVHDNPWRESHLRKRLEGAADAIGARVRGQREAIQRSVDILVRAVLGLSGAHAGARVSRPRGVLFFAGPTGVGKTQLAKELTRQVFGDENAYTRFDMSEFSAEHAADRLIGAPPGYVGFDAGGELTNAVRQRPFSLLLFDEVEKAHPRILDKFLQILDDGRLTDAGGATVYFTETVLVFTSNLGVSAQEYAQRSAVDRPALELRVRSAVEHHFVSVINRPELLNRLGDNIVVFNFIDRGTAEEIFTMLLDHVTERLRKEHRVALTLADPVRRQLLEGATRNLSFGGRGIGSFLESALVNPLARELFTREHLDGARLHVTSWERHDDIWRIGLS